MNIKFVDILLMLSRIGSSSILKVFFSNSLSQIINLAYQFVTIPFFIKFWGTEYYGEWLLLYTIPGYIVFSDFGLTAVINNEVLGYVVKKDFKKAVHLFNLSLSGLIIVVSSILLFAFLFLNLGVFSTVFKFSYLPDEIINQVFLLLVLYGLSTIFYSLILGVFKSVDLFHVGILCGNFMKLTELFTVIIILSSSFKADTMVWALLSNRVLFLSLMFVYLVNRVEWLRPKINFSSFNDLRPYVSLSISYSFFPLGQAINIQGSTFLVGYLLGPAQTVLFTTVRTLVNSLKQGLEIIKQSVWVEISKAIRSKDFLLGRKIYQQSIFVSILALLFGIVLLFFWGDTIYEKWTSSRIDFDYLFFNLLLLASFVNASWFVSSVVLESVNRHSEFALYYVLGMFFFLLLMAFLMIFFDFGLYAFPISSILIDIFLAYKIFFIVKSILYTDE